MHEVDEAWERQMMALGLRDRAVSPCPDCERASTVVMVVGMLVGSLAVATLVLSIRVRDMRDERQRVRSAIGIEAYTRAAR